MTETRSPGVRTECADAVDHALRAHAICGASFSGAWTVCAAAPRLSELFPDEESEFSAEGTKAHEVTDRTLKHWRDGGLPPEFDPEEFSREMVDAAAAMQRILEDIIEPLREAGEPYAILIEQRLDFSRWVPEGFGTGDLCVVSKKKLWLIDLKFGKGISVDAEHNPQLKLYGLGVLEELAFAFEEIEEIELQICQPRTSNFSEWSTTKAELLAWAESIVPAAHRAFHCHDPKPEDFTPGEHCSDNFCRARFQCRARAEHALSIALDSFTDMPLVSAPSLLSADEIAVLLPKLPAIKKWATELLDFAQKSAIEDGIQYPGFKIVEGRSNRYISDVEAATKRLKAAGYEEADILKDPALVGITELEKLVGKKAFAEILEGLINKPQGKPVLVPNDDKRSVWQGRRDADSDFGD